MMESDLVAICREHGWDGDRAHIALAFLVGRNDGDVSAAIAEMYALDDADAVEPPDRAVRTDP